MNLGRRIIPFLLNPMAVFWRALEVVIASFAFAWILAGFRAAAWLLVIEGIVLAVVGFGALAIILLIMLVRKSDGR